MLITLIMSRIRIHITVKIRLQIRIEGKRWIRIRFEVKPAVSSRRFIGSAKQKALNDIVTVVPGTSSVPMNLFSQVFQTFYLRMFFFLPQSFHYSSRAERRSTLKEIFGFTCGCDECSQPDHVVAGMNLTYRQSSGSADFSRVRVRYYL